MAAPPRFILHAGHPKTGTSALQCSFARSIDAMARQGVHYPAPDALVAVCAGRVSSGNVHAPRIEERYRAAAPRLGDADRLLFSTEAAFRVLPEDPRPIHGLIGDGVELEVLLFVRNPVGLARSVYGQVVQGVGVQDEFDRFLDRFGFLDRLERFLDLRDEAGFALAAWNYAEAPEKLLVAAEAMLELAPGTLHPPPRGRVNRSLAMAELRALRAVAARHGAGAASAAGEALRNRLPDVAADPPVASAAAYAAFRARLAPQVERINHRLPGSARLRIEPYEEVFDLARPPGPDTLSPEQAAVLDEALAAWHRRPGAPMRDRLVRTLNTYTPGLARWLRGVRDRVRR